MLPAEEVHRLQEQLEVLRLKDQQQEHQIYMLTQQLRNEARTPQVCNQADNPQVLIKHVTRALQPVCWISLQLLPAVLYCSSSISSHVFWACIADANLASLCPFRAAAVESYPSQPAGFGQCQVVGMAKESKPKPGAGTKAGFQQLPAAVRYILTCVYSWVGVMSCNTVLSGQIC